MYRPPFSRGYHKVPCYQVRWGSQCGSLYPLFMWSESKSQEPELWNRPQQQHPAFTPRPLYPVHTHWKPPACLSLVGKLSSGYTPLTGGLVRSGLLCRGRGTGRDPVPSHTPEDLIGILRVPPSPERQLWFQTSAHFAQWPDTLRV